MAAPVAPTAPAHALTGPAPKHPAHGCGRAAPSLAARTAQQRRATPVRGWNVELGQAATTRRGQLVRTARTFETLASWERGGDPVVEVRYRSNGVWSDWEDAHPLLGGGGKATEPLWAGPSRTVRVRVDTARPGLALVLVDPGYQPSDEPAAFRQSSTTGSGTASGTTTTAAMTTSTARTVTTAAAGPGVPMPNIRRRAEWGANPDWRGTDPSTRRRSARRTCTTPPGPTATAARTCRGSSAACTGTTPTSSAGATSATTSWSTSSARSGPAGPAA